MVYWLKKLPTRLPTKLDVFLEMEPAVTLSEVCCGRSGSSDHLIGQSEFFLSWEFFAHFPYHCPYIAAFPPYIQVPKITPQLI